MSSPPSPLQISASGQGVSTACRISGVIWEAAATKDHLCTLTENATGQEIVRLRAAYSTATASTCLPVFFPTGIPCPQGFNCAKLDSGTVIVYFLTT